MGDAAIVTALCPLLETLTFFPKTMSGEIYFVLLDPTIKRNASPRILNRLLGINIWGNPEPIVNLNIRAVPATAVEAFLSCSGIVVVSQCGDQIGCPITPSAISALRRNIAPRNAETQIGISVRSGGPGGCNSEKSCKWYLPSRRSSSPVCALAIINRSNSVVSRRCSNVFP